MFRLENRGIIKIAGPDAAQFLHNITTNDVLSMRQSSAIYNLILNSKGRFLFDFFVIRCKTYFLLDCCHSSIKDILALLRLYRMLLKVKMKSCEEYYVAVDTKKQVGVFGEATTLETGVIMFRDPRHISMGMRYIVPVTVGHCADLPVQDQAEYDSTMIANTVPDSAKCMVSGESFPLHFGLDKLNAISFTKGCYTGQEVVARMYRIGSKKGLYTVIAQSGEILPDTGIEVTFNDQTIGHMLTTSGSAGLCLLEVAKAPIGGATLQVVGIPVVIKSGRLV